MLTSFISKLLLSSLLSSLAFAPLVYVMSLIPEGQNYRASETYPIYNSYDEGNYYTADQLDPWRGAALCGHDSMPDLRGRVTTTVVEC